MKILKKLRIASLNSKFIGSYNKKCVFNYGRRLFESTFFKLNKFLDTSSLFIFAN